MKTLDSLLKQKIFNDNYELTNKSDIERVNITFDLLNRTNEDKLLPYLEQLDQIVTSLSSQNFDEISIKFITLLNEFFKRFMNKETLTSNHLKLIMVINTNMTAFYNHFMKSFQNYNDKHKVIIKNLPNYLKVYFNLFHDKLDRIRNNIGVMDSFFINIVCLVYHFPNMIRSYELKIEMIIKTMVLDLIYTDLDETFNKSCIKSICLCYGMFVRLSTDPNAKLRNYIKLFSDNIISYREVFKPKTMKSLKGKQNGTQDALLFGNLKETNALTAKNLMSILFKLLRYTVKAIPRNINIDLDINVLFDMVNLGLNNNDINTKEYIIEGLSYEDDSLLRQYMITNFLKLTIFVINEFHGYIYFNLNIVKEILNKLIITEHDYFENYTLVIKLFKTTIKHFDLRCKSTSIDIIFKFSYANFIDILISYLERNDKTIVKVDQKYFKLASLKKNKTSLLQIAKQEACNQKLDGLSEEQLHEIMILYFDSKLFIIIVFITFFQSEGMILLNNDQRNQIKILTDILIYPSYAKFIFSISDEIKEKILDMIYYYLTNHAVLDGNFDIKIYQFLKVHYTNSTDYRVNQSNNILNLVFKIISMSHGHLSKSYNNEDLTYLFIDFNKRLAEKIKSFDFINFETMMSKQMDNHDERDLTLHEEEDEQKPLLKKYFTKFNKLSETEYITKDNIYVKLHQQNLTFDPLGVKTVRTDNIEIVSVKKPRRVSHSDSDSIDIPDLI
jgi:hypothetical protein